MIVHQRPYETDLINVFCDFSHYQKVEFSLYCSRSIETSLNQKYNNYLAKWLNGKEINTVGIRKEINTIGIRNHIERHIDEKYINQPIYYSILAVLDVVRTIEMNDKFYPFSAANNVCLYHSSQEKSSRNKKSLHLKTLKEYLCIAQNWLSVWEIPNFPKDADFPIFDYLQDHDLIQYLLPERDGYYYLNLNGFNIKHKEFDVVLKEINQPVVLKILNRIIRSDYER